MLKRDGENCEHPVLNYPGLLTTSEFRAYNEAIPIMAEQERLFNERANILSDIEKRSPQIAEDTTKQPKQEPASLTLKDAEEITWQIQQTLFKTSRGEMLLCSRDIGKTKQFGIIEKFPPNSPYARIHGEAELQITGNNAFVLVQNFVENERAVLQLFRKDIEARVEEHIAEKFPELNGKRVVKAISARCVIQATVESETEKPARSIKIRM
jgi:hypothetical protein